MRKTFWMILLWILSLFVAFLIGDYIDLSRGTLVPAANGRFLSTPKVEMLDEGRLLRLLEDFVYVDPNGDPWLAPLGRIVDGASIPKPFWSFTGGPLTGKYRNASIVHDIECDDRKRPSEKVHLMFYHACLTGGVPEPEAKRLYWAVARFGPRWASNAKNREVSFTADDGEIKKLWILEYGTELLDSPKPTPADVAWADSYFSVNNPPIEIVDQLSPPSEQSIHE